jgi:hypothetical protein
MGFIVIIPFASLAAWCIVNIFRWLQRLKFGQKWWNAFAILTVIGIALGIGLAFILEYKVANKRIAGFPIPLAISTLTDGQWTRQPLPAYLRYPAILTNLLLAVTFCLAPLAVAAFLKQHRSSQDLGGKPDAQIP